MFPGEMENDTRVVALNLSNSKIGIVTVKKSKINAPKI